MKKIVFGVSALVVFLGVSWTIGWSSFVEYAILAISIPVIVAFLAPFAVGEFGSGIPGFVVQCIALLVIIVVTLPIGDFRLGEFFKENRRHSLLVVLPLGLFAWIMLCAFGTSRISIPSSNIEAALAIVALYSLHIVVFRRTTQDDIPKDPYSLNKKKRSLSRYIFRVSMLSATIWAILGIGIIGLGLPLIIMPITASVSLVIRIFTSGDFSENNLLFVATVLPMPIAVLWMLFIFAAIASWPESWS